MGPMPCWLQMWPEQTRLKHPPLDSQASKCSSLPTPLPPGTLLWKSMGRSCSFTNCQLDVQPCSACALWNQGCTSMQSPKIESEQLMLTIYLFVYSPIDPPIHQTIYPLPPSIHPLSYQFTNPLIHSSNQPPIRSRTHLSNHLPTHPPIHPSTQPASHPHIHLHTLSFIHHFLILPPILSLS